MGCLWQCLHLCEKLCNHPCCSSGPRKSHFGLTCIHHPLPSCTFVCRPHPLKLFRSTPSPSNSVLSDPPCTTPVSRNRTFQGDLHMAAWSSVLLSCSLRPEWGLCELCLGPGWVDWCLMNQQIENIRDEHYTMLFYELRRKQRSHWSLTFLGTWLNSGFTTLFDTKTWQKSIVFLSLQCQKVKLNMQEEGYLREFVWEKSMKSVVSQFWFKCWCQNYLSFSRLHCGSSSRADSNSRPASPGWL